MKQDYSKEEQEVLKKFGVKLKKHREEAGLSQEKLAFKGGMDRTYVGSVERGERNISLLNINKLASALGVQMNELLSNPND